MPENQEPFEEESPVVETIEQVAIPFLDDMLLAALGNDGDVYCPIAPFCRHLGISDTRAQIRRIRDDETMSEGLRRMAIQTEGGQQLLQCISVDMLTLWLIHIREKYCKESIRPLLKSYKRQSARVIRHYFMERAQERAIAVTQDNRVITPSAGAMPEEWANYHRLMSVLYDNLAAQQKILEEHEVRLSQHDREIAAVSDEVMGMREAFRIAGEVAAEVRVSPQQASEIQQLVGTIHEHTGLHRGTIFGALKKEFNIPRYDELPAAYFDGAMEWLRQWGRARLPKKPNKNS